MIQFAERTHPGRRSGDNEDVTGCSLPRHWYFVADGMGGQGNGRVASSIVKQSMESVEAPQEMLFAIHHAHQQILAATERDPMLRNMGSTIVSLEIKDRMARAAWVGDSRAYLYRDKQLKRITRDHSYVEVLRLIQGLTEEQVRGHPESNVITR
ncbi:MAG: serine/threonine-protein phosphatase, partial [Bradyrhizobium sp.]|nr:serine/threonine-protein phosphatase [Bradyrhizobium sp.]